MLGTAYSIENNVPRRYRVRMPDGRDSYGCYFPHIGLFFSGMGEIGTGEPQDVEWIDGDIRGVGTQDDRQKGTGLNEAQRDQS